MKCKKNNSQLSKKHKVSLAKNKHLNSKRSENICIMF